MPRKWRIFVTMLIVGIVLGVASHYGANYFFPEFVLKAGGFFCLGVPFAFGVVGLVPALEE